MNRTNVILLAVAVVLIGAVTYLAIAAGGGPDEPVVAARPRGAKVVGEKSSARVRDHRGRGDPAARTHVAPSPSDADAAPRVGERVVADHRGAPKVEVEKSPYKIAPLAVGKARVAIRPIVKRCSTEHAGEIDGDKARVQAVVHGHVESGVMTIASLDFQTRGVPGEGRMVDCIRQGLEGFSLEVPGAPDVEDHKLTYPFDLPLP
jgi:hypothetical protein